MSEPPLAGLEVVEICSAISGPFACKLLSDYGAHVTKVEPLSGEHYRNLPPRHGMTEREDFTPRFLPYNTGKDSVAVDLKTDAGTEIAWELVEEADVLVENMRPGVMARLGFPWGELRERNPGLVYCDISGYGDDGPYVDWPAIDTTVQAVSGWADQIGAGEPPDTMNIFLLDHATAVYTALGACMALIGRGTTGRGRRIEISMLDAAISFLNHHFAEHSAAEAVGTEAKHRGSNAPNDVVSVADGYVAIYVSPEGWPAFCEAIGRPEFTEDGHRFSTKGGRLDNRIELREALDEAMRSRTQAEWTEFINEDVERSYCAPVNRVPDLFTDPQVRHRGSILSREHPVMGDYTHPRPALRFSEDAPDVGHAPGLGEHTDEILGALGYSEDEVATLRERDVIR